MNYNLTGKLNNDFILDDSQLKETINIVENLIDEKLEVEIEDQDQLITLLNNPEAVLTNEKTIADIKDLKELIFEMSELYNAGE